MTKNARRTNIPAASDGVSEERGLLTFVKQASGYHTLQGIEQDDKQMKSGGWKCVTTARISLFMRVVILRYPRR